MPKTDGEVIDAKLEEIDRLLEGLRKRRQELQEAKEAVKREKTVHEGPEPSRPERSEAVLEETLNSLEWKSFKKKEGEWTFLRDREGRLRDELESVKEFVDELRNGRGAVVGKYRYAISEDRFLNRFLASA
ncbi:MAG: hypothetical protein ACRD6W_14750 [Nitrososphaerales archaeon]